MNFVITIVIGVLVNDLTEKRIRHPNSPSYKNGQYLKKIEIVILKHTGFTKKTNVLFVFNIAFSITPISEILDYYKLSITYMISVYTA